jgi:ABC-type multidrug transport system fused ATPase/permease subunit
MWIVLTQGGVRNVSFAYEEGNLRPENLNFAVEPGKNSRDCGQTGSGKTSLIRLINRTYDPG